MIVQAFLRWVEGAKTSDRARAARALARAFLMERITSRERDAAAMALNYLLDDPSPVVRLALAESLCASAAAPRTVVLSLAEDQPEIAATILVNSPALTDDDLVDLIGRGSATNRALIAARPKLSRGVAAAIVEVGEAVEVAVLLDNPDVKLGRGTLERIAQRHGHDCGVRTVLLERDDLPANARHSLMQHVGRALVGFGLVQALVGEQRVERIVHEAKEVATVAMIGAVEAGELPALVEHLRREGRLTPAFLMHALCSGKVDFIAAALVSLSGLEERRVRAIVAGGRAPAIRALYESAGLSREISPVFVEATLIWRGAHAVASGVHDVAEELLGRFRHAGTPAIGELLAMVEKLRIAEERQAARASATLAA